MDLFNLKILLKCWKVGIFTTILDLGLFIFLQQTDINLSYQLYISMGTSTLVGFFLQKYWTFKNENKGSRSRLIKQISFYSGWQVLLVYIITRIVVYISNKLDNYIATLDKDYFKDHKILKEFVKYEDDRVVLNTISSTSIKHIVIFIIYTFISVPLYSFIFKYL